MNPEMHDKLDKLKNDYLEVTGVEFEHFFCPILYKDENAELCKAHIINQVFEGASRKWTIQRKDVDNFYGANFESEFVLLRYRGKLDPFRALGEKYLNPKILVNGEEIEHYRFNGHLDENFTPIIIKNNEREEIVIIKIPPAEVKELIENDWEIENELNLMIPSIVSLIKSAYLTLFEILGYTYVFSKGGYFIGKELLGKFFELNHEKSRREIKAAGNNFFSKFQSIIRPVNKIDGDLSKGSVESGKFIVCKDFSDTKPWAYMIFINFANQNHVVLLPYLELSEINSEIIHKYKMFVDNPRENITVRQKVIENGQSYVRSSTIIWPKNYEWFI